MAAVERDIVPDGDIVTDLDRGLLIEGMEDGAVLDIHIVADADGVDVTAEDGVEPGWLLLLLSYAKIMNPWGKDDAYISPIEGPPLPFTPHTKSRTIRLHRDTLGAV